MAKDTAYNKQLSIVFAKRLLELRKANGKSRERVTAELSDPEGQYGIEISVDSLCNYEQAVPGKRGIYSNDAMKVGYLRAFADYYGVSTDYLLGLDDCNHTAETKPKAKPNSEAETSAQVLRGLISYHERMTMGNYPERDFYLDSLKYALSAVEATMDKSPRKKVTPLAHPKHLLQKPPRRNGTEQSNHSGYR